MCITYSSIYYIAVWHVSTQAGKGCQPVENKDERVYSNNFTSNVLSFFFSFFFFCKQKELKLLKQARELTKKTYVHRIRAKEIKLINTNVHKFK